jgi:hypothetical protein
MNLSDVEPAWAQLVDDEEGLTVLELDEAVVDGAPWEGWPVQLAVELTVADPDATGQPYDEEHAQLLAWESAFVAALGDEGRLVCTITAGGVRELVAYLRSTDVVASWEAAPPAGLGSHEAVVTVLPDPEWRGLREIAGVLGEEEEPLRPPA